MDNTFMAQKAAKVAHIYECELCHYLTSNYTHYKKHLDTIKHKTAQNNTNSYQNNTFVAQKVAKVAEKRTTFFECELCDYFTSKRNHYNKHLGTDKHKKAQKVAKVAENSQKWQDDKYYCECGKSYKHKPNLYSHRKKCKYEENKLVAYDEKNIDYKELFFKMIDKNDNLNCLFIEQLQNKIEEQNKIISEKDKTISELIPKIGGGGSGNTNAIMNSDNNNNTITNTNTNSNNTISNSNNSMNINLFLNENCKDAISIDEFVKKIEITLSDLLFTKQKGLINGLSNIFIRHLTNLPVKKRPLWCSDKKRKKIFIKQDDWSEDVNNLKTKKVIKDISFIQAKNVNKYTEKNPDWKDKDIKKDEYIGIVKHTTGDIVDKEGDVINKLVDTIYLDDGNKKMIEQ